MDSEWEVIARQFDRTRQRPWPEVLEFIDKGGERGLAVACGNGRHLIP
ncbi:MAG TPA: class I SAM-dependent methyltransferase, partial [Thermoplasmatales archaeon]|nr:class I SAM-dependent methyltransferase [Thermoplasmatales archaeon]